jgi:hypothetical protein
MLDVVSMLMPLRRQQKSRFGGDSLARVFAEEYFAHVPTEWQQRLPPHYAWGLLREASGIGMGPGEGKANVRPGRREKRENHIELLVEEARAVLAGRT